MKHLFAILLVLALSGLAHAAGLPQLRSDLATADARVAAVRSERTGLQRSLDELAQQIAVAKNKKASGLFGDAELDSLLKRSQELSGKVTDALRTENEAESLLRGDQAKLVTEIDQELGRMRARWDAAKSRDERQALVGQLKALKAERDTLRRSMPATLVPAVVERPSDDPEELLERADALLDGEDKLRREQQALDKRIAELRSERDVERRMSEYLGEDALFDEQARVLSATRTTKSPQAAFDSTGGVSPAPGTKLPVEAAPPGPSSYSPSATMDGQRTATPGGYDSSPNKASTKDSSGLGRQDGAEALTSSRTTDATKAPPDRRVVAPYSEDETLEQLAARRDQVKKLADDMHRKANDAVSKAKDLR
jgi:uncharacterized coiled-coil DUF342 family protein